MPRLRGPIQPEKQRKKSFFSKFRKRDKSPSVEADDQYGSDVVELRPVTIIRIVDDSHRRQELSNNRYQHQSTTSKDVILKIANMVGMVYMTGRDIYAVTSHWNTYYAGTGGKQTYFSPAPWAFFMWPVIHVLVLGGCIYQFSHQGSDVLIYGVGWKFPLLQFSNVMYIRCRDGQRYKYALVWVVVTYMILNKVYRKISKISSRGILDQLFCHFSISLYHGWVLGLMFLACFEAFGVDAVTTPAHIGTKIAVLLSFMLIQLFEWAYASPATEGDFFACLAVSWFLFAITAEQSAVRSAFIHWSAHGFTTFSLCWIVKCMIGLELKDNKRQYKHEERAPLFSGLFL